MELMAVWWLAETLATIGTKRLLTEDEPSLPRNRDYFTHLLADIRWFELTAIQHLISGVLLYVSLWAKKEQSNELLHRKPCSSKQTLIVAVFFCSAGDLAMNASYACGSPAITHIIRASEPLIHFILTTVLLRKQTMPASSVLYSLFVLNAGAGVLVLSDPYSNILGCCAALLSTVAFTARDIAMKKTDDAYQGKDATAREYACIYTLSGSVMMPVVFVNRILRGGPSLFTYQLLVVVVCYFFYSLSSAHLRQSTCYSAYSKLSLSARIIVTLACLTYFPRIQTWMTHAGVFILLLGGLLWSKASGKCTLDRRKMAATVCAICVLVIYCILIRVADEPDRIITFSRQTD